MNSTSFSYNSSIYDLFIFFFFFLYYGFFPSVWTFCGDYFCKKSKTWIFKVLTNLTVNTVIFDSKLCTFSETRNYLIITELKQTFVPVALICNWILNYLVFIKLWITMMLSNVTYPIFVVQGMKDKIVGSVLGLLISVAW